MSTHKALVLSSFSIEDPLSGIKLMDVPTEEPKDAEVLVRVTNRPINPADGFSIAGVYPGFTTTLPAIPGLEGVGVVEKLGPKASSKFKIGQRVVAVPWPAHHGRGTWQQFTIVDESNLVAVPDAVNDDTAAQFLVNPVTIVAMLDELNIPKGSYLLQTGAGSVLGRQMIQLAKHLGIHTINVVRDARPQLVSELKALDDACHIIDSSKEDIVARVKAITNGQMAYAAIECIGGELFAHVTTALRNGGTSIIYGAMGGLSITASIPDLLFRDCRVRGFWLNMHLGSLTADKKADLVKRVMDLLANKVLTPFSGKHYPLEQFVEAFGEATKNARGGKVFLQG